MESSAKNNLFIQIGEEEFSQLTKEVRACFKVLKVEPNDKYLFEGDSQYSELIRADIKASKALTEYKFNKRHSK
tara:strand:+ start:152 stop:373 length:222 start_codon:yes stop_codon:yes gene_type:complete